MGTHEKVIAAAGLKGCSARLAEIVMLTDLLRGRPENIWFDGDSAVTSALTKFLLRDEIEKNSVPIIDCARYGNDLEYLVWDMFGAECETPNRKFLPRKGLIEQRGPISTIWVDGANHLDQSCVEYLSGVIAQRGYRRWGGSELVPLHCRWILTTGQYDIYDVKVESWMWYLKRLKPEWIQIPSLRERPEDIRAIAEAVCGDFRKRSGIKKQFSRRSIKKLVEYDWLGGHIELENAVFRALIDTEEKSIIEPWDFIL